MTPDTEYLKRLELAETITRPILEKHFGSNADGFLILTSSKQLRKAYEVIEKMEAGAKLACQPHLFATDETVKSAREALEAARQFKDSLR